MLILLTAWFVHNWWKILIGLLMVIVILEIQHRKKRAEAAAETDSADIDAADNAPYGLSTADNGNSADDNAVDPSSLEPDKTNLSGVAEAETATDKKQ